MVYVTLTFTYYDAGSCMFLPFIIPGSGEPEWFYLHYLFRGRRCRMVSE